jgi:PAS domain S-box-containing protein
MFEGRIAAAAFRTYLLETAPVLALRLDADTRITETNAQGRRLLGNQAVGRPFVEMIANHAGLFDVAALGTRDDNVQPLSLNTPSGMPQTLYFRFFPLRDGWLALGSLDLQEQQKMFDELLALNSELSNTSRQLHQVNAELQEVSEQRSKLAEEMKQHNEMLRQQTLASLNLMEDTLEARDRAERANAALRESEAQFRTLVEAAPEAIFVHEGERFRYLNATACRLFGADSPEQLLDTLVMDRIHPSSRDLVEARIEYVRDRKETAPPAEVTWQSLDGRPVPVDVTSLAITFQGRDAILAFARDITDQKKAQEALRRTEQNYRKILEAAPDAMVLLNGRGDIVLVNAQAERMFGSSRDILLRQNISLLLPERFRGGYLEQAAALANSDSPGTGAPAELFGLRADGAEFPIELTLSPFETEEGLLLLNAIRDVTERKEQERRTRQLEITAAEAEAASKAKSMFLSTMSHEIRTPMNAILGYSQLMLRDPTLGPEAKANLKIVTRSGEHLLNVINQVLDMAKIEAGGIQLTPQTINLPGLLRDLEAMFRLRAEANAVNFEVLAGGESIRNIVADEGRIRQVLINLLGNAFKFTERGRITLRVALHYRSGQYDRSGNYQNTGEFQNEDRLWLTAQVEDTGIGMTAEEQSKLFQPFVQGQAGQHIRHGGTGLGLAISRGVVQRMGGAITVTSQPGEGSTFRFEIPVERGPDSELARSSGLVRRVIGLEAGREAPRILIADDVADNREWLSRLLSVIGFLVRTAENGEAALSAWEEWRPHLILMDMHMPVMGGLEATRHIRSRPAGKETIIIALTADVLDGHRRVVLENEVNDFLGKPCPEAELLEKIRSHLGLVYIYQAETADNPREAQDDAVLTPLTPEQMRHIPAEIIEQLHDATISGDKARLDDLILTIKDRGATQSAVALQELANSYEYDRLIDLLDKV